MQALEVRYALVAQLDRVTDYESVGRGFESLPAYQKTGSTKWYFPFFDALGGLERPTQPKGGYKTVQWTVL